MKKFFTLFVLLFSFIGLANAQNTDQRDGNWYSYDGGSYLSTYEAPNGDLLSGVMFPAGTYEGDRLSEMMFFSIESGLLATVKIYNGGESAPGTLLSQTTFTTDFSGGFLSIEYDDPVFLDNSENLWIVLGLQSPNGSNSYVSYANYMGDPNSAWVSNDAGASWEHQINGVGFYVTTMISAYIESEPSPYEISKIYVNGFTPPVWGAHPDFDLEAPADAHYQIANVGWLCGANPSIIQMYNTDVFDHEYDPYWMECRIIPDEGYYFSSSVKAYLNGDASLCSFGLSPTSDYELHSIQYLLTNPNPNAQVYNFDDGTMQGWFNIDADGDGHGWTLVSGSGHNSSGFVASESYDENTSMALDPDNYLILSDVKLGGSIKFWACAENQYYPEEHFGVAVSTTGTDPECFSNIQDWTLTAKQGSWHEYTADLGAFEGQTGYVAIRHYNSADNYRLNIDDIEFVEGGVTPQPTAITEIRLNGFTAPVWGAHPDVELTVPSDAHYTISEVTWFNNDGSITVTPETVYDQEGVYYMKVILAPAEDYVFDEEATVYFNDDASICDAGYNLILDNGNFRTFTVDYEVTNPSTTCTITAEPNPTEGGTATGGGTFNKGETCTLTATANSGYQFVNWTKNGSEVSTNATYSFTVTGSGNYLANFFPTQTKLYTLTVQCNPAEGAVTGNGTYAAGTVVEVQAIPYKGYAFDRWNDGNTQNPRSVTLDNNMTLVAFFKNTGVGESGVTALRVYPNPANDNLHIEGLEADTEVQFYNSLGMMVKTVNVTADEEINISDLPQGIYMIRCGQQMLRFVKTN